MFTRKQRPSHLHAYTIIESLVVIALLVIFTWVCSAVYLHEKEASEPNLSKAWKNIQPTTDHANEDTSTSVLETEKEE